MTNPVNMNCLRALAELVPEVILVLDTEGAITYVSPAVYQLLGVRPDELRGQSLARLAQPDKAAELEDLVRGLLSTQEAKHLFCSWRRRDGAPVQVEIRAANCEDVPGLEGLLLSVRDISEQLRSEATLRRANRALRVLSAGNTELIQAEDEATLLEAVCRICVELGGYRMAWVGFLQDEPAKTVRPVAQAGVADGYLERIKITAGDEPSGRGPTGRAIRSGEPQVSQNILTDPRMEPWRESALQRGFQSSVALPLREENRVFGALMIYAVEPEAFQEEELRLLTELADDLAYGLVALRIRARHREAQKRIAALAYFDELTSLPNQNSLLEELSRRAAALQTGRQFGLVTVNLVSFGDIQAAIGVQRADQLLKQIAARMETALLEGEMLARIGGDEFAILTRVAETSGVRACVQRIEASLAEPFQQAGISISVQVRCGAAIAPLHGKEPEALLLRSDVALRRARRAGMNFVIYDGPTESENPRHLALITDLRAAIENEQLTVHYQPKVDLRTGQVTGLEALVRWPHPERGLIMPADFIGIAEQTGLIKPLTHLVTDTALRDCCQWRKRGLDLPVAVNISVKCFGVPDFLPNLEAVITGRNARPELLQLEITESTLMEDPAKVQEILERLGRKGIQVFVDDFGTGFSSLNYVASLPIHGLKIDRSFVISMLESPRTYSVIKATVSLALALGIRTVAEGVDDKKQLDALKDMGCSEVQGYYLCKPMEAEAVFDWVRNFSLS